MLRRKPLVLFLCRLVILYAILAAPWPWLSQAYGNYFRAVCRLAFTADNGRRELSFETAGNDAPHPSDTRIVIVNKALMLPDGSGPVRNLDVSFGWQSMALLLALILATPVPWRRRCWALLWGLLAMHAVLLLFLNFCIWGESAEISLVTLNPFWKALATGSRGALASQLNLAVPILIWLLVTFRREDRQALPGAGALLPKTSGG